MNKPAAYILDLDGVVYRGRTVIPGACESIDRLRSSGRRVVFLTNNATRTREAIARRLVDMGIPCSAGDVISSAYAASIYIKEKYGSSTIYPVGEQGLIEELELAGHTINEQDADYVVAGLDREFTYEKLTRALDLLMNGARFIATNDDAMLPTEHDFLPGAGSMVAAIQAASGEVPDVIGKPNKPIMDVLLKEYGLKSKECVMVGDRLETDILAGIRAGMRTVLVLTGASGIEDIESSGIRPDAVLDSIADLE
ncbi:MAG: Glyceraldehyde 3-phosphate phosphatase [ANME-2 cluster archaeon]|nr:Glyceraldehyde 3-phosphate phosphatase [ANME-2 cluster archaeon]